MDDLSPEIIKKYQVLQMMAEGGMGAVYKVRHRRVGTLQVIKLIRAPLQAREDLRERFRREAMTAMQLRHPNIVEVTDYDVTEDGTAYIVMEFIQGVSLREVLARAHGPLDYRFVVNIAQQALAALGYMHRKKNVHRDISPDNFVLTRDDDGNPHVKLIDLGIAKSAEQQALTKAKGFLGKASYAPPEQFRGEADTRSDLYAFGVMLYELLTDSRPIVGPNELAIMASHLGDRPRPFSESDRAGRVPDKLRAIVMKALEKDPAARWQTAQEFAAALKTCEAPLLEKTIEVTIPILLVDAPASREEEQEDWDEAKAVDSIVAWERYLERNPHSQRASRARVFLEALESREQQDWQRAANADTIEGWNEFIGNHGDSPRVLKARGWLEKLEVLLEEERAWTDAAEADSVASWRRFLTEHVTSLRADEARGRAAQAKEREDLAREQERERSARAIALRMDTEKSLLAFLESFPSSPAAADVRRRIVTLEAARLEEEDRAGLQATTSGAAASLEEFVSRHPQEEASKDVSATVGIDADAAASQRLQVSRPKPSGRRRSMLLPLIVLFIVVLGTGGWVLWNMIDTPIGDPPASSTTTTNNVPHGETTQRAPRDLFSRYNATLDRPDSRLRLPPVDMAQQLCILSALKRAESIDGRPDIPDLRESLNQCAATSRPPRGPSPIIASVQALLNDRPREVGCPRLEPLDVDGIPGIRTAVALQTYIHCYASALREIERLETLGDYATVGIYLVHERRQSAP